MKVGDHINLNIAKLTSYELLKCEIIAHSRAIRMWAADDGAQAMEVNAISKGDKGKGNDKDNKGKKGKDKAPDFDEGKRKRRPDKGKRSDLT
eukprot:1731680-Amphidinium_carterae.1